MSTGSRCRPGRLAVQVASVVFAASTMTVVGSVPAHAEHQTCTGDYPPGTVPIGYPDFAAGQDIGWNGQVAQNTIDAAVFATSAVKTSLLDGAGVATSVAEIIHEKNVEALRALDLTPEQIADAALTAAEAVARLVAMGLVTAALLASIAETVEMSVQRDIEAKIAGEDACASVMAGDMVDQIWVATVERNLASDGPPLALALIPTDSKEPGGESGVWPIRPQHEEEDFAWCPEIDLPETLPEPAGETDLSQPNGARTGGDCSPGYFDGFLNEPYEGAPRVTVQAIVRDAIDHSKAHHLPVRDAETYYAAAVAALSEARYKEAFQRFRRAYQAATGLDR